MPDKILGGKNGVSINSGPLTEKEKSHGKNLSNKITRKMKKEYIKNGGTQCPFCESTDLNVGELEEQDQFMTRAISCTACNKEWREGYGLDDVYIEE